MKATAKYVCIFIVSMALMASLSAPKQIKDQAKNAAFSTVFRSMTVIGKIITDNTTKSHSNSFGKKESRKRKEPFKSFSDLVFSAFSMHLSSINSMMSVFSAPALFVFASMFLSLYWINQRKSGAPPGRVRRSVRFLFELFSPTRKCVDSISVRRSANPIYLLRGFTNPRFESLDSQRGFFLCLNPDFALDNGILRKIRHILRPKKVRQYLRVLPHLFGVYNMASLSSLFFISNAKSGLNIRMRASNGKIV